jgi:hypothetical protein
MWRQNGRSGPVFEKSGGRNILTEVVSARTGGGILKHETIFLEEKQSLKCLQLHNLKA